MNLSINISKGEHVIVMVPILLKFGSNMRNRRITLGLTLQMLANITNLDRTHLSLIEVGKQNASLQTAEKIADALELPVEELLA